MSFVLDEVVFNGGRRVRASDGMPVIWYTAGNNYRSICSERPTRNEALVIVKEQYERNGNSGFNSFWMNIYEHDGKWRLDHGFGTAEY